MITKEQLSQAKKRRNIREFELEKVLGSIFVSGAVLPVLLKIPNLSKLDSEKILEMITEKVSEIMDYISEEKQA